MTAFYLSGAGVPAPTGFPPFPSTPGEHMAKYVVKRTEYASVEAESKQEAIDAAQALADGDWDYADYDAEKEWGL
ncbi:hypothetical protein GCM10028801_31430 [Nocardioides maradonensis]